MNLHHPCRYWSPKGTIGRTRMCHRPSQKPKPNVSHLVEIGTKAFVHIPKKKTQKLDPCNFELPQEFLTAHNAIASAKMPIYTHGILSHVLLLGDLVSVGIVEPPTNEELADLSVKANNGAINGLQLLRFRCHRDHAQVAGAIHGIRQCLNTKLPESVNALFGDGEVGLFDVEHILCKVVRKQGRRGSRSPVWLMKLKQQG